MSAPKIPLAKIGEFGLIDQLARLVKINKKEVIKGIGDDAAVLAASGGKYLLLTTDMLAEGRHFTRTMGPGGIGRKALACSLSDIAAMGGLAKTAVVSLAVPPRLNVHFVYDMYKGMQALAKQFHVNITGGDTIAYKEIIINIALLGEVEKQCLVLRSGARKGDKIFVTGPLGRSLKTGKHLSFVPRIHEARFLVKNFKPTAMIDISDGLAGDLAHITQTSRVGAHIYADRIPRVKGASLKEALYDGEDFELLFTLPPDDARWLVDLKKGRFDFTYIGDMVTRQEAVKLMDQQGKVISSVGGGFTHF